MSRGWLDHISAIVEAAVRRANGDDPLGIELSIELLPPSFATAAAALGLSKGEQFVLACLAAAQLESTIGMRLQALSVSSYVSRAGISAVVYHERDASAMRDLSDTSFLIRSQLVELESIDIGASGAWARRGLRASQRALELFVGADSVPSHEFIEPVQGTIGVGITTAVVESARDAISRNALVVVNGRVGVGRRTSLVLAAERANRSVITIDAAMLATTKEQLLEQAYIVARECRIQQRIPLIRNVENLVDERGQARLDAFLQVLLTEVSSSVLMTCGPQRPSMRWGRPSVCLELIAPSHEERSRLWLNELGQGTKEDAEFLATQYPLAPALIHHAAKAAKARANGRKMQPDDIYAGIRAVLDDKLGDYAKRVEVTQTWDDLVLPDDQMEAVQYLIARIRQRRTVYEQWGFATKVGKGLGTSALFSGPPGTGKTMVAALIAKELGLELYQVDMAKITSKYIGETERNLAALFDAAEAGHAILLFDEADSLFGKRTEVKSSNDRYANLETNYLLQRLESFTGICLLTSNHESNIDPAFQRRLSLHVRFELPEVEERAALWRAMLPPAAPVAAGVDFMSLARRFVMSGGYIRNAALRAAFLAADEGSVITGPHLERAAKLEYEGMGKIAA